MSQNDISRMMLVVTVIRAEGLGYHAHHGYYAECTVGEQTKKTKIVKLAKKDRAVKWNEVFSFTADVASKLLLKVLLKNLFHRDEEEGRVEIEISGIQVDNNIQVPLSGGRQNIQQITIRCSWKTQAELLTNSVLATSKALQTPARAISSRSDRRDEANGTLSAGKKVASAAKSWEFLVVNLELFNTVVTELSEIHPYAKAALSILKGVTGILVAQIKRDDRIVDLIGTMNDTYDFVREGEPLSNKELYGNLLKAMALQTIECGYFIQAYLKDGFFKRTVKSLYPQVDKAIDDYQTQFTNLRSSFESQTSLDTVIQVYRIINAVGDLSATINLNEITYADGMRFKLEFCCLKDTRRDILDSIINWADNAETETRVLLLTGLAGSGKSSIAHSVASHFKNLDRLGSSFFCTRTDVVNSQPEKMFSTITRNIAGQNKQVMERLSEIVRLNKSLCTTKSVREQFQDLLRQSCVGLTMVGPLVIVIDALDECEGDIELRRELMRILAEEISTLPKNFRLFLTARSSDRDVENAFRYAKGVHRVYLEEVDQKSTNQDIFLYIGKELSPVAADLSESFPDWQRNLTSLSGGLFIWASTACRFIYGEKNDAGVHPLERYKHLGQLENGGEIIEGVEPMKGLYSLYTAVLSGLFNHNIPIVKKRLSTVLGLIITAFTPLTSTAIDELLNAKRDGRAIISRLGSLLTGWNDTESPVQVLHASFQDYLTNSAYSSHFHIDNRYRHLQMVLLCLGIMNRKLKFNICEFEDPYAAYEDIQLEVLEKKSQSHIGEALQYACRHWAMHIVQTDPDDYESIKEALHQFLFEGKHLMQWIEVLSVIKYTDSAKRPMRALFEWTKHIKKVDLKTHSLVYDCCRFLESFSYPLTVGPLQCYLSALPYVPAHTTLYQSYSGISSLEPTVIFGPESKWPLRRSQLHTNRRIRASAFSSNGTLVACISDDGEIQLFDFATSMPLGTQNAMKLGLRRHLPGNTSIALSLDVSKVAVSHPERIEVWDIKNGANIYSEVNFQTKYKYVPITFQSDDCVVACGTSGNCIVLWRFDFSSKMPTICTFSTAEEIKCIALSANGLYIGCVLVNRSVSLWDANTKSEIVQFDIRGDGDVTALGISSDGNYVAVAFKDRVAMWWRVAKSFIWDKFDGHTKDEIFMPLSIECRHFVTSGWGYNVWDMATGECREHNSELVGRIQAVSPDGQFLVASRRGASIYSVESDADEVFCEFGENWTQANTKPHLLEGESLRHMIISPSGSVVAAGITGNTRLVFVWDGLTGPDAAKQILKELMSGVWDVRISPDGMRLACQDDYHNVTVWTRYEIGTKFKLVKEHAIKSRRAAENFLKRPSLWVEDSDTVRETSQANPYITIESEPSPLTQGDVQSEGAEQSWLPEKPLFFVYEQWSECVTLAGEKKLWWIPNNYQQGSSNQRNREIVVYGWDGSYTAVVFKYIDNVRS